MEEAGEDRQGIGLLAVAILTCIALVPFVLVDIPAIADYPNNLARMYLLSAPAGNPFYEIRFSIVPNLAMDLLIPPLAPLLNVATATKIFVVFSKILIVTGAVTLEFVVKGRHQIAGFVAAATLHSTPFAVGLMNFEFALGLALFGIASWIRLQDSGWALRLLVHAAFVVALFLSHFLALGIYGATIGLYELHRILQRDITKYGVPTVAILAAPALAMFVAMRWSGGSVGSGQSEWLAIPKLLWVCCSLNGYSVELSAITFVALVAAVAIVRRHGTLALAPPGLWVAIGLMALFLVLPARLFGSFYTDVRVLLGALLILPAFLFISSWRERKTRIIVLLLIGGPLLANTIAVASVWTSYRGDFTAMVASFGALERASIVLVGKTDDTTVGLAGDPFRHAPTLAAHYAGALVPSLFAIRGAQPIKLRDRYAEYAFPNPGSYDPVPFALLKSAAQGTPAPGLPDFINQWTGKFDYLYLLGPRAANPLPDRLSEVAAGDRFALYRIRK